MPNKASTKEIERAYRLFRDTRSILDAENWSEQLRVFLIEFRTFTGTDFEERMFSGWVAAISEQAYYIVAHGKDLEVRNKFENEVKKIFRNKNLPHCLTSSKFILCGKRQPALIDSINPTFERFKVLEELPKIFDNTIDSIILGGSMSYVPFLGVRDDYVNNDFSDIDLIFIQSDSFFNKDSWNNFRNTKTLYSEDKELFLIRVNEYERLFNEGRADIISQRFKIKGKKYTISIHFFSKTSFKKLVNSELSKKLKTMGECDYLVRNYRVDAFYHPCQARLSFDGSRIESGVVPESYDVKYGHIVSTSGFTIKNCKLYPGPFLTVVLPALQVFHTKSSFANDCLKKLEKLISEQASNFFVEGKKTSYAKAHHRYFLFCPGRYDDGHDSYVSPEEAKKLYTVDPLTIKILCASKDKIRTDLQLESLDRGERERIKKKLERWKQKELAVMSKSIDSFMKKGIQENMDISSFRESRWVTVATVKARSNIVLIDSRKTKFIATYTLSPNDIMSSLAYSKLSNKIGKVYISSHFNPVEPENSDPITYTIIVKLC